jgi:hypothetical protein
MSSAIVAAVLPLLNFSYRSVSQWIHSHLATTTTTSTNTTTSKTTKVASNASAS